MNLKTKLGVLALAMLALTATNATATEVATTEPLPEIPIVDDALGHSLRADPVEVEACAAAIPPLCGPAGNDAARAAAKVFGIARCYAVQAGGGVYQC